MLISDQHVEITYEWDFHWRKQEVGIDDILDHSPPEHNTNRGSDTLYQPYVDRNLRFLGLDHFLGFQHVYNRKIGIR